MNDEELADLYADGDDEIIEGSTSTISGSKLSSHVRIRFSNSDIESINAQATAANMSTSQWVRHIVRVELDREESRIRDHYQGFQLYFQVSGNENMSHVAENISDLYASGEEEIVENSTEFIEGSKLSALVTVRFSISDIDAIKSQATNSDMSVSQWVRKIINEELDYKETYSKPITAGSSWWSFEFEGPLTSTSTLNEFGFLPKSA